MNNKIRPERKKTPSINEENKLKTSAVDRLVEASKGEAEEVSKEELQKYKSGRLQRIPAWIKALVIKYWFSGAICFFFLWGLGTYVSNQWDIILILGLGSGVVTDLLTNNFLRFLESSDREFAPYIMFTPIKKFWTLFANVGYSMGVTVVVVYIYELINSIIIKIDPAKWTLPDGTIKVPLGVEPLLFALFYLIVDMALIGIKDLIFYLIRKKQIKETDLI